MKKILYNKYIKKSYVFLLTLFMLSFMFTPFINATEVDTKNEEVKGLLDIKAKEGTYRLSEDKTPSYLPFIRYSRDRLIVDKEVSKMGALISVKTIEVLEKVTAPQLLFSADSVRINADMGSCIVFTSGNVVVDSNIKGTIIIFSNGDVTFTEKANVSGDILCISPNLDIKSNINGSVISTTSKNVNITGKILGDLRVNTNTISILNGESVSGNVYVETYNKDLVIKDKFPNAIVKIVEVREINNFSFESILKNITIALVFTLFYLIVQRVSKTKAFESLFKKMKKYPFYTLISGALTLISIPLVLLLLFVLSMFGLEMITIPIVLIYATSLIVIAMLSAFITGGAIITYMKNKYFANLGFAGNILAAFCVYLSLQLLILIPYVGGYISTGLVMISIGAIVTSIFKKNK